MSASDCTSTEVARLVNRLVTTLVTVLVVTGAGVTAMPLDHPDTPFDAVGDLSTAFSTSPEASAQMSPSIAMATNQTTSSWPMFGFEPARTGHDPDGTGPKGLAEWWNVTLSEFGDIESSPAIVNGTVYIGVLHFSSNNSVYALNASTGAIQWSAISEPVVASPTVVDGTVYVGSDRSDFYALDARSGSVLWNFSGISPEDGVGFRSSPAVVDGMVFVGSDDGNVYALNASTGALVWNFTTGDDVISSPAVADGRVFVGSNDRNVYALDAATGALIWNHTTELPTQFGQPAPWIDPGVESSPAVAHGSVFVGSNDGHLYALNASTGAFRWRADVGGSGTFGVPLLASPAVVGNLVVMPSGGTETPGVFAYDVLTGSQQWGFFADAHGIRSSPAIVDGVVYVGVGSDEDQVFAINLTDGALIDSFGISGEVQSSPAVVTGSLYIGVDARTPTGSRLYALREGPRFVFSNLDVSPQRVSVGDTVVIQATVTNEGALPGEFTAELHVNGTVVNNTSGRLDPGASTAVSFTQTFDSPGSYTISLADLGPVTVLAVDGLIDWPTYGGNDGRTGAEYTDSSGAIREPQLLWTYEVGSLVHTELDFEVHPAPTIFNGIVYIPDRDDQTLFALDMSTGGVVWSAPLPPGTPSSVSVADGIAYVHVDQFEANTLLAFDITDGNVVWSNGSVHRSASGDNKPVIGAGSVFIGGRSLSAFDAETGAYQWTWTHTAAPDGSAECLFPKTPALATAEIDGNSGVYLFVPCKEFAQFGGSVGSAVAILNATTGEPVLWNEGEPWPFSPVNGRIPPAASIAVVDSDIYVTANHIRFTLDRGELSRYDRFNERLELRADRSIPFGITGTPTIDNGTVYVGGIDNKLHAFATDGGSLTELWTAGTHGTVGTPVVANGIVYIGSADHTVRAFDAATGIELWSIATDGAVVAPIALGDDTVVVHSSDGRLYAIGQSPITVTDVDASDSVAVGDSLTVTAFVENTGARSASQSVPLRVNGELRDEESVTLGPGEQTVVSFDVTLTATGIQYVGVGGHAPVAVTVSGPSFTISSVSAPERVTAGDQSTAEVTLRNDGEDGTAVVNYRLGPGSTSVPVTLGAGQTTTVSLSLIAALAGGHYYHVIETNDDRRVEPMVVLDTDADDWTGPRGTATGTHANLQTAGPAGECVAASCLDERWNVTVSDGFTVSPAVVDGVVYAPTDGGAIYAFDAIDGSKRWQAPFDGARPLYSPAVDDGAVALVSSPTWSEGQPVYPNLVHVFDAETGTLRWTLDGAEGTVFAPHPRPENDTDWSQFGAPLIADGTLYISRTVFTGPVTIDAYDLETGEKQWSFAPQSVHRPGFDTYLAVQDGVLFVTASVGLRTMLYAIDVDTGDLRWATEAAHTSASVFSEHIVGPIAADEVVIVVLNHHVRTFDSKTGRPLDRIEIPPSDWDSEIMLTEPERSALGIGEIYIPVTATSRTSLVDNWFIALNLSTGRAEWTFRSPFWEPPDDGDSFARTLSWTTLTDGVAYVTDRELGLVHAVDTTTGDERWIFPGLPQDSHSVEHYPAPFVAVGPAAADETLYVGTTGGRLFALTENRSEVGTAEITASDFQVSPTTVSPGTSSSLGVSLTNTGDAPGYAAVRFNLTRAGTTIATSRVVRVPAGTSIRATQSVLLHDVGTYQPDARVFVDGVQIGILGHVPIEVVSTATVVVDRRTGPNATLVDVTVTNPIPREPTTIPLDASSPSGSVTLDSLDVTTTSPENYTLNISIRDEPPTDENGTFRLGPTTFPLGYVVVDHSIPDENVTEVRFTFRVNKTALDPLLPFDVRLYRFVDGTAVPVSTTLVDETDGEYVFEAVSPGLSVFAVGADLGGQLEIEVSPDQTAIEGDPVTVALEMNSSFAPEELSVTIDWGDGITEPLSVVGTVPDLFASGVHTFRDDDQYVVDISVRIGAVELLRSTNVTVSNAPPVVEAEDDRQTTEGARVTLMASFADPGVEDGPWNVTWDFGDGTDPATITTDTQGDVETDHVYLDDGEYVAEVCVTDKDRDTDCDSLVVTVLNVAPTVSATGDTIDEGETATVRATFTDSGILDTHTASVDWGDGTPPESVAVEQGAGSGNLTPDHTYGDDGDYTVTVTVTDDDGGVGTITTVIDVENVAPTVDLNTNGVIQFHGGDAFLGRLGVEQSHTANATDSGSDDLTFTWDFEATTTDSTYFNDGQGPDPPLSPDGTFPFAATDTAKVTFEAPGVYTGSVTVTDDDGGTAEANLSKVVTGNSADVRGLGFWRHQYSGHGQAHYDDVEILAHLDIANYASGVFSEQTNTSTFDRAAEVLSPNGPGMRNKAEAQSLAAWLNFAAGGVGWSEKIDTDGDGEPERAFHDIIGEVEAIITDPEATETELEHAKNLAESINIGGDDEGEGPSPVPVDGNDRRGGR